MVDSDPWADPADLLCHGDPRARGSANPARGHRYSPAARVHTRGGVLAAVVAAARRVAGVGGVVEAVVARRGAPPRVLCLAAGVEPLPEAEGVAEIDCHATALTGSFLVVPSPQRTEGHPQPIAYRSNHVAQCLMGADLAACAWR